MEERLLRLLSSPAQDRQHTSTLQMWSLVHLVYTISVLTLCLSKADLPSASLAAGIFTLWPDQLGSMLDLSWIPCSSIRAPLCCFHRKPWTKVLFLTLGDSTPWESREEGERKGAKKTLTSSGWCEDGSLILGPHSVANAVVSPALTHKVLTRPF